MHAWIDYVRRPELSPCAGPNELNRVLQSIEVPMYKDAGSKCLSLHLPIVHYGGEGGTKVCCTIGREKRGPRRCAIMASILDRPILDCSILGRGKDDQKVGKLDKSR